MKLNNFLRGILLLTIAASLAVVVMAQSPSPSAMNRAEPLVINTELVSFSISVTDREGRYFAGLDRSAFSVFEDGVAQEVTFFGVDDGPASIGIVFDLSGSMTGKKSERAKEALARFVQTGHRDDEYSLFAFNERTQTLLDRVRDGETLMRAVGNITPGGNTALYDAAAAAIEHISQGRWEKRALIVISDGEDNRSRTTLRNLRQKILEAGVNVYVVITDENRLPRHFGAAELRALAAHSGGSAFKPETAERLAEIFDQIAVQMRQRYSLGYTPTNLNASDRWRSLKVKLMPPPGAPRLLLKTRAGYYVSNTSPRREQKALTNANDY